MTDTNLPATQQPRQALQVQNVQPMLDTARFEHFQRAAKALMHSSILNPSVRGDSPEQCFSNLMLVFDLSDRWKLPALSIAQGIAIVHNKVVYEGKLIAAMLDASLGARLDYFYTGQRGALDYRVYVSDQPWDQLTDEQLAALKPGIQMRGRRIVDGSVGEWRTFQKDGRTPNPAWTGAATQNQLAYRGAREWARRYEPAQMLGVYGDDEIDAITLRMEARDVTPAAPGLSGGFTKPAEPIDAEIEEVQEVDVMDAVNSRDQEASEKAKAQDLEKASQEPQEPEKTAEAPKARGNRRKPAGGKESAPAAGEPAPGPMFSDADMLEAYELGKAGTPIMRPDNCPEADWQKLHSEWLRGADEGPDAHEDPLGGDEGDDDDDDGQAQGDQPLDAIREAEPEMVDQALEDAAEDDGDSITDDDALDAFVAGLAGLENWKAIKAGLNVVSKTDAWKGSAPSRIATVRARAWTRQAQIIEAGAEKLDVITDLTAFRCWIETTTDVEMIQGTWETLVHQPVFTALTDDQRGALERAVLGRIQQIRE